MCALAALQHTRSPIDALIVYNLDVFTLRRKIAPVDDKLLAVGDSQRDTVLSAWYTHCSHAAQASALIVINSSPVRLVVYCISYSQYISRRAITR